METDRIERYHGTAVGIVEHTINVPLITRDFVADTAGNTSVAEYLCRRHRYAFADYVYRPIGLEDEAANVGAREAGPVRGPQENLHGPKDLVAEVGRSLPSSNAHDDIVFLVGPEGRPIANPRDAAGIGNRAGRAGFHAARSRPGAID